MAKQPKQNPVLKKTIRRLRETAKEYDAPIWDTVADHLGQSTRRHTSVNLSHIQTHAEDGDIIVVPGKVLGAGRIDKNVTVAAFQFSDRARTRIEEAGTAANLLDFVEDHKKGRGIRLMKG